MDFMIHLLNRDTSSSKIGRSTGRKLRARLLLKKFSLGGLKSYTKEAFGVCKAVKRDGIMIFGWGNFQKAVFGHLVCF
jgi:hypothetical protein